MPVDVEKRSCLSIMLGLRANTCRLGFKAVVTMRATRYGFNYPWVKCPSMWKNGSTMRDKVPTQAPCRTSGVRPLCVQPTLPKGVLIHSEIVLIRLLYLQLYQRLLFRAQPQRKKFLKVAQETGSTLVTKVTPPDDRSE